MPRIWSLHVSRDMVSKWRSRFRADQLDGLSDEARPGRPQTITDDDIEQGAGTPPVTCVGKDGR